MIFNTLQPFKKMYKRFPRKTMIVNACVLSLLTITFVKLRGNKSPADNSVWLAKNAQLISQIKLIRSRNETEKPLSTQILCLILTVNGNDKKTETVSSTWAKRCDEYIFVYGNANEIRRTDISLHIPVPEGREHLTAKVRFAFQYVYQAYNDSFDWILKCDDDTYIIVENLRLLLSNADPEKPRYLGFHMKIDKTKEHGYMSGGAGYVISYSALHQMIHNGFKNGGCLEDGGDEDVEIGLCLSNSSVQVFPSLDVAGKETFHPEALKQFLYPPHPQWLLTYAWNQMPKFGSPCCSKYSISFHYLSPEEMYVYEHLLYNTEVYKGDRNFTNSTLVNPKPHD